MWTAFTQSGMHKLLIIFSRDVEVFCSFNQIYLTSSQVWCSLVLEKKLLSEIMS